MAADRPKSTPLALNYIGQGALLLADPDKIENPFSRLYPDWTLLPISGMAATATIIASQAVITHHTR